MKLTIYSDNLRSLRRTDDGFTMIDTHRDKLKSLCDCCALHKACNVRKANDRAARKGVQMLVDTCRHYIVPIFFPDATGLEIPGVNTFRVGKAFQGRLRVGDQVSLIHRATMEQIRRAQVSRIGVLEKDDAIDRHSSANHLFAGQKLSKAKAAALMRETLPKLYGPLVVNKNRFITVIYFD